MTICAGHGTAALQFSDARAGHSHCESQESTARAGQILALSEGETGEHHRS